MRNRFATIIVSILLLAALAAAQENVTTRPDKQETIEQMIAAGRLTKQQQSERLTAIMKDPAAGATPRSDFMFCTGLAYRGERTAQRCVAAAYEHGRGVVQDLMEAYAWYAVAAEGSEGDEAAADRERVKSNLVSGYPFPSDNELDDAMTAQKSRIAQYQNEANKAGK